MWSTNLTAALMRAWRPLPQPVAEAFQALIQWFSRLPTQKNSPDPNQFSLTALKQAQQDLAWAQNCFNSVTDSKLLDYSIYQMLAAESRYSYYLGQARGTRLKAGIFSPQ